MIKIVIADDHPSVIAGVRWCLSLESDMALIGEASNGREALQSCIDLRPEVLLLDLIMPGFPPDEIIYQLKLTCPEVKIIIFTTSANERFLKPLFDLGIKGYLRKDESLPEIVDAIRSVVAGRTWFSQRILEIIFAGNAHTHLEEKCDKTITDQEFRVIQYLADGLTDQEIAKKLGVSCRTVRYHVGNILQKLHVSNRTQAVVTAIRLGLIDLEHSINIPMMTGN